MRGLAPARLLLAGLAAGVVLSPPVASYGTGTANAPCPASGRTIREDFYVRVYVRDCTWAWDAAGGRMRIASGPGEDGLATNEWVHFKASARCSSEEWYRRVVVGREPRSICQHRGGHARS